MSRQPTESPTNGSSVAGVESLLEQLQQQSEEPSSGSQGRRMSKDSEGYPSWLPKRPLHPAPASTVHGSVSDGQFIGGRKPTPRSVRIVSMQDASVDRREPTDQTKVNIPPPRVWSRGMGTPLVVAAPEPQPPQPRFHATGLHLELLRNPGLKSRLHFYLFPFLVLAHIPLQTFFDFNAVFMLIQISKSPNPQAPGVPGSGRNWTFAAAAYVACWLVWIFPVVLVYELVYSFVRRWRVRRPVVLPLYLSSSGYNFVCMTSFTNFCFMQHLRRAAFFGERGSWRDGMAETFWFYSQNLPTVALLLPRAGLCLALLLAFSTPDAGIVALADAGLNHRDKTFFRVHDGTLTSYARGVLIANAAWTAWRALVVLCSWIGLWIMSGTGCAGLCGPRSRWEEEDAEKTISVYSDNVSDLESLPWQWREATALRVQEAFEFCLTVKQRWSRRDKEKKDITETGDVIGEAPIAYEGMERVMAVAGFPSVPPPARRGVLSGDLFDSPVAKSPEFGDIIPKVARRSSKERESEGPLMTLPYPFTGPKAQMSSQDRVPFPPSPRPSADKNGSSGSLDDGNEEVDDDDDDEEEEEDDEDELVLGSEEPSSGRASGSMSSLGHPVTSRYPFQFRRPGRGTSGSSHASPTNTSRHTHTHSQSTGTGPNARSLLSQSTGNRESSDSHAPRSQHSASASSSSMPAKSQHSASASSASLGIPMPPRHPQQGRARGRGRTRAGTVPAPSTSSSSISMPPPTPVDFPRRPRARTGETLQPQPAVGPNESFEVASDEDNEDEDEREDQLGLLTGSASPSPRTSLRQRASNISLSLSAPQRRTSRYSSSQSGSGSGNSRSRTQSHSGSSSARSRADSLNAVRSRAQSLLQNMGHNVGLGAGSFEGVGMRIRANSSMARLEEDMNSEPGRSRSGSNANTHSRSGSGSDGLMSSGENNTFGHPLRTQWHDVAGVPPSPVPEGSSEHSDNASDMSDHQEVEHSQLQPAQSRSTVFSAPSFVTEQPSEGTISRSPSAGRVAPEPAGIPIPIIRTGLAPPEGGESSSSYPDLSSAPQSFVTAPATIEGATTESSGRTVSSWDASHMHMGTGGGRGPPEGTWRHPGPA
ncbi:OPT oligopeptide transporter [Mycena indigotica]|uniref:OPT oligopeptide transporter n=1 Tax=Mycena indigotica TaxID=2126181 RepID=A0A8H6T2I9_9AGAR|nr:OPT oligopeptide transporter [Mycena indigotica]KAF7309724.1 OPT oligopeptide transporter [Mycena indigotica]